MEGEKKEHVKKCCCGKKPLLFFLAGFIFTALLSYALFYYNLLPVAKNDSSLISPEEAKIKAENFINDNLAEPGGKITVSAATEENGLYKVVVDAGNNRKVNAYISKDGKIFFSQAMNISEIEQSRKEAKDEAPKEVPKTEKPNVELFVMSHCPYGTQMEKGILPAVENLGDKINFEIKFTDYCTHGEKEINEELRQHCIKTEEPSEYYTYLKCFLNSGESEKCLKSAKINLTGLNSCIADTDSQYKVTANFNDRGTYRGNYPPFGVYKEENTKYGVNSSPTLVINGTSVASQRDPASLLKTICSGFVDQPVECGNKLSTEVPAPGFGGGTSANGGNASCN